MRRARQVICRFGLVLRNQCIAGLGERENDAVLARHALRRGGVARITSLKLWERRNICRFGRAGPARAD